MRKLYEKYHRHEKIRLLIGEGGVYKKPSVVTTVLGSCVSVTFFCHAKKIGAIFHAIMPFMPDEEKNKTTRNNYRYVDSSIDHILHSFYGRGIKHNQIEAKLFGGSQILIDGPYSTGVKNLKTAYEELATHKIKIVASDVGGQRGRSLIFITNTGEVFVKNHKASIIAPEKKKS